MNDGHGPTVIWWVGFISVWVCFSVYLALTPPDPNFDDITKAAFDLGVAYGHEAGMTCYDCDTVQEMAEHAWSLYQKDVAKQNQ